ncbi:hypothetical protein SH2C18_34840 [Clostridium sediminicola]|uniref:MBL fold metallo-hydrolase n=1 Tax=Clostridium sediminicola TaxID=3114879 RepID=UPI0031F1E601
MINKTNNSKGMFAKISILLMLIFAMINITACQNNSQKTISNDIVSENTSEVDNESKGTKISETVVDSDDNLSGNLKVHYIDVGQGDAILIQCEDKYMLIDAGKNDKAEVVKEYLKSQYVDKLEYVIATHPHEDHIGGIDVVIDNFDIGKVIMPKVTATTRTYKDVINSIKNKNLKITVPKVGTSYSLGDSTWEIVAPNASDYEDTNNYSVCIKLTFDNNSFLFTGDAEDVSEKDMINNGIDLSADVLKLGHHGSRSSTTEEFLAAVKPKYAIVSAGRMNDYGHPHKKVINRLESDGIPVYRTDECSTIIAISDGENITFNCNPGSYLSGNDSENNNFNTDSNNDSNLGNMNQEENSSTNSNSGIEIIDIDKVKEIVTIKNNSDKDVNLEGWTLVSVTGNQKYDFEDYIIKAGDSITVASGKADGDIKWSKSYVWNNESEDEGQLINSKGMIVSYFKE